MTRFVVLAECTSEKPSEKFSALSGRARELREAFPHEFRVLPIVFTPSTTTESELELAAEFGVSLMGRRDLEVLLGFLETSTNLDEVLDFLRTLRPSGSITVYKVG